jgi:hypothetical protein
MEVAKLSLPKPMVAIPKLPKLSASSPPPTAEEKAWIATKKGAKTTDILVFTEAALKEFIARDIPGVTEMDRQQEVERKPRDRRDAEIQGASDATIAAFKRAVAAPATTTKAKAAVAAPKEKTTVSSVPPAMERTNFSLFRSGGGAPKAMPIPDAAAATKNVPPTAATTPNVAPHGVPMILRWKIDPGDCPISVHIRRPGFFKDGEPVTTSSIVGEAAPNTVGRAKSVSRFFLGDEDESKSGGIFGFFGGGGVVVEPKLSKAPNPLVFSQSPSSSSSSTPTAAEKTNISEETAAAKKKANEMAAERKRIVEATAASNKAGEEAAAAKREAHKAVAKREALAQTQREAEKHASEEAYRQREAQEDERRLNAKKKKHVEFDCYQGQLETVLAHTHGSAGTMARTTSASKGIRGNVSRLLLSPFCNS